MLPTMVGAVIYVRVSTKEQTEKARKARVREEIASAERIAKAIQDKLDRLDEAFLFSRSGTPSRVCC
jgi:DNA invertase Pin-like site-specific DNA recombinase